RRFVSNSLKPKSRLFTRSPRRQAREVAKRSSTFDAFFFEALNKRDHLTLFGLGHLELRHGPGGMTKEHVPVAIANPHASVRESHVPAAIVHWSTRARAKKIDEKLLFAHDAVFSAVRPEPPELRIGSEPGQKIIRHCCDCAISTQGVRKGSSSRRSLCPHVRGRPGYACGCRYSLPCLSLSKLRGAACDWRSFRRRKHRE